MKKTFLLVVLLSLSFSLGIGVFAQGAELPNPGLSAEALAKAGTTPDSPFYFLEIILEKIGTFFIFDNLKKAERYVVLAAERVAEAQAVTEKGKSEKAARALKRYEMQLNKSIARAIKAQAKGQNVEKVMEVIARVGKATSTHLEVLSEVYNRVSGQAKSAIENAMKVSVKGHAKAVLILKAQNFLGDVPRSVSPSKKVPEDVRKRIQEKAQEELRQEKSKLPNFKSFEVLEIFCLERGGPSELCSVLEAKCREMGVTTADECFRVFSTSTIETDLVPDVFPASTENRPE